MPILKRIPVKKLRLDLHNFRTVEQVDEQGSLRAMVAIHSDWVWSLAESLLEEDGYTPLESILVLEVGNPKKLLVQEGNRRVAILKLAHGYLSGEGVNIPENIKKKIKGLSANWLKENKSIPCIIYGANAAAEVDRIVARVHGKAEQAGRDKWPAVATARHAREKNKTNQPALDLLEGYLKHGENLNIRQKEQWAGDYSLTVLDEFLKRHSPKFGVASSRALASAYPNISHRAVMEDVLMDIGLKQLTTPILRDQSDILEKKYGVPSAMDTGTSSQGAESNAAPADSSSTGTNTGTTASTATEKTKAKKGAAVALNDPRAVTRALQQFKPSGANRAKVVSLLEEAKSLKLDTHPFAFCFLLRSMFEISAKAYCVDNQANGGPTAVKADGNDRFLVEVLRDITTFITKGSKDKQMTKKLHGAMADLATQNGFLSVTSFNQLVHNPSFSVDEKHISTLFANIFPLLEAMN